MPVMPGVSFLDPTRYHTQLLTIGAVWISFKWMVNPLGKIVLITFVGFAIKPHPYNLGYYHSLVYHYIIMPDISIMAGCIIHACVTIIVGGFGLDTVTAPIVAVIGAGPAGLYAAKQLTMDQCHVVLFNRDIKPGGLAEYGIYPDKLRMKEGLRAQFRSILSSPQVHYFGNVQVGEGCDISIEQIRELGFHAVLAAVGAQSIKHPGIPGENLHRVYHAKEVVYHYNGLPPYSEWDFPVGKKVAIVGVGNVMLDVARWLMDEKKVDDVIAIARRGPAEVKFDRKELEMVVERIDFNLLRKEVDRVAPVMASVGQDPYEALTIYTEASQKAVPHTVQSRMQIRFLSSPKQILGDADGNVRGLELEGTTLKVEGDEIKAVGTGIVETLDVDTVIFAIGDAVDTRLGLPVAGNQFVKNIDSRFQIEGQSYESCSSKFGKNPCGVFVAGWARKASSGVVGIARKDGVNAAFAIREFLASRKALKFVAIDDVLNKIREQIPAAVEYDNILYLEAAERVKGTELGIEGYKFTRNEEMMALLGKVAR
jgi:ferredoxin--NADP+ reductase